MQFRSRKEQDDPGLAPRFMFRARVAYVRPRAVNETGNSANAPAVATEGKSSPPPPDDVAQDTPTAEDPVAALERQLAILRASTSWRMTAPLRWVASRHSWLHRPARRVLRAIGRALVPHRAPPSVSFSPPFPPLALPASAAPVPSSLPDPSGEPETRPVSDTIRQEGPRFWFCLGDTLDCWERTAGSRGSAA